MRRYLGLALAFLLAVVSVSALAMGLGEIRLNSHLNQRLDAEIELVSAAADELESLKVGLASRDAYARYGLEREDILSTLQFRVVRRPNGTAYVKVTSSESIKEPFLTFLIEANWSRGKLLREYTVLLDPPTFAGREDTAPAEATAPAVRPEQPIERTQPVEPAREPVVAEPEQPEQTIERPRVAEEQTSGDVISIPSLDSEVEERPAAGRSRQQAAQAPEMGGTYGPIQRNETLWGLAMRLRPDESITINQMMMALYRANPEAFQGNINRLKAGYILRIPEYAEIRGLDRGEAFREAKRHNEEWEAARAGGVPQEAPAAGDNEPQPAQDAELSLVAPEEETVPELGTGVGAGGEADDLGLATEDSGAAPDAADDVDQDATGLDLDAEPSDRLLDIEDESLQALQSQNELAETNQPETEQAEEEVSPPVLPEAEGEAAVGDEETVVADETAETGEAAVSEPAQTAPVVAPVRTPEPSLLDRLMEPLGLGVAALVLMVLLLAGVLAFRKRREANQAKVAAAVADWNEEEESDDVTVLAESDDDDVTVMASQPSDEEVADIFEHDFGDEDTGTRKLEDDTESTQLIEEADKTQLISPQQGADTNFEDTMVGGQAVTLDDNDPTSEADFHMAYGLYDQAAEVVERAIERDPSRTDWIAKLAEIHFAANNTDGFLDAARSLKEQAGPGDSHWDNVAIMGRQIASDDPLFAESGGGTGPVDLDFGSAGEEFGETGAEPEVKAGAGGSDDDLDFDMSFDSPSEPAEHAAPAAKPQEPAGSDSDLDFDMDLSDFATTSTPAEPEAAAESAAEETSGSDSDFNFDLGEFGDQGETEDASAESQPESKASESSFNDAETQTEFDRALQELSAYVDTNLPEQDAGDAVSSDDDQGGDLNLDEFKFDQPDEDFSADTGEGTGDDEDDIGEIGTKLDLARAYIDMGDPDGARGILDEVLADGDEDQKKEAQDLMAQLG